MVPTAVARYVCMLCVCVHGLSITILSRSTTDLQKVVVKHMLLCVCVCVCTCPRVWLPVCLQSVTEAAEAFHLQCNVPGRPQGWSLADVTCEWM